jgi:hypothetical protein
MIVPEFAIHATRNRLEWPKLEEGFDELHFVRIVPECFTISPWNPHEV